MELLHFTGETIPQKWKEQLAHCMHHYEQERADWPVNGHTYQLRHIDQMTGDVGAHFELAVTDELLGYSFLEFRRVEINDMSYATLRIYVEPNNRRAGMAKQLLEATLNHLPEAIKTLRISIKNDHPINQVMMDTFNVEPSFIIRLNISKIRELKLDIDDEIEKRKKNLSGYKFIQLNHENYPVDDKDYASLMEEIWNANIGKNTSKNKEEFPVSRLNGRFESIVSQGGTIHTSAVKSYEGQWIGLSEIFVYDTNPRLGSQSLTGVREEQQRKGIGTILKLMNLQQILNHTGVTHILTGNADQNEAILTINTLLGFQPSVIYNIYEISVDELKDKFLSLT